MTSPASTAAPPTHEPDSSSSLSPPLLTSLPAATSLATPTVRRSLHLNSPKRLSTCSNPSREAPPTPDLLPSPRTSAVITSAPSPVQARHKIPSFPPPTASRISLPAIPTNSSFQPQFPSSLPYAVVRDFAYPSLHPLHYGPPPASEISTPASSQRSSAYFESGAGGGGWFTGPSGRRVSDPAVSSYGAYGDDAWGRHMNQPPPLNFSDGPPWSEDEDLQSPVVVPKGGVGGHRKYRSTAGHLQAQGHGRSHSKNVYTPTTLEHYPGSGGVDTSAEARAEQSRLSKGEFYTQHSKLGVDAGEPGGELFRDEDEYGQPLYYLSGDAGEEGEFDSDGEWEGEGEEGEGYEGSRFSKDYQFTIASPDEEMHGKAVALFDFVRENENELPLAEGQVVWVSYRHGMGWLVAEDPKTGESGLVPEEYVRLFRDLALADGVNHHTLALSGGASATPSRSPTPQLPTSPGPHHHSQEMNPSAIISTFSTSSTDCLPFHLPGSMHATGPEVSHPATPTAAGHKERIEQIRREQERAVREMEEREREKGRGGKPEDEGDKDDTPRLGSGRFGEVEGGPAEDDEDGAEGEGSSGVSSGNGARKDEPEVWDADEAQSGIDFREGEKGPAKKKDGEEKTDAEAPVEAAKP